MAMNSSQRPDPGMAVADPGSGRGGRCVCIPLWQWTSGGQNWSESLAKWTPERLGRLFLGPEQIASYFCFTWAGFILLGRYLEVRRQQRAFSLDLMESQDATCILPEDGRLWQRKVEQRSAQQGPFILSNMIRLALGKYAVSRSGKEVSETIRTQAEVDLGRLVSSMATVHYLAWAIPAIGFLGTVARPGHQPDAGRRDRRKKSASLSRTPPAT